MLLPGNAAPEIALPDLDGAPFSLHTALKQGPVVVAFFKVSCPTCQMTFPYLQRLVDAPEAAGQLIAISQDSLEDTREFQQRCGVSMRTLLDAKPRYAASNTYQIGSVPSIFIIEKDGTILGAAEGFHKAAIEDIGTLFGVVPFRETDQVPTLRPG
jgi:peroxiredoxin